VNTSSRDTRRHTPQTPLMLLGSLSRSVSSNPPPPLSKTKTPFGEFCDLNKPTTFIQNIATSFTRPAPPPWGALLSSPGAAQRSVSTPSAPSGVPLLNPPQCERGPLCVVPGLNTPYTVAYPNAIYPPYMTPRLEGPRKKNTGLCMQCGTPYLTPRGGCGFNFLLEHSW